MVYVGTTKEVQTMAQLTIEQIHNGKKYNVMSAVVSEYLKNGKPKDYDERTWIELLIVKHSINAAYKMQKRVTRCRV